MTEKPVRPGDPGSGIVVMNGSREGRSGLVKLDDGPYFAYEGASEEPPGEGDPLDTLRTMVSQAQEAINADLFFPALMICLALPDICGGLASGSGGATGKKTVAWLVEHGGYTADDAALIYGFRCSLLHQGSARPHKVDNTRIAFVVMGPQQTLSLHWMTTQSEGGDTVFWMTAALFVDEICEAVDAWIAQHGNSEVVARNLEHSVRLRPDGLLNQLHGGPVIA